MRVKFRRRHHAHGTYEYVDIVESERVDGKVRRRTLGTLGRRDQLPPHKVDALVESLRKLASPEGLRGTRLGAVQVGAVREYGVALVVQHLFTELGLDQLLKALPQTNGAPVAEAVFRMVVNRLCDPHSKLGLVDWVDEHETSHRGWQGDVHWPSGAPDLGYNHYLRAMDRLHPHRDRIEEALFSRVVNLLSLPLRLVPFSALMRAG